MHTQKTNKQINGNLDFYHHNRLVVLKWLGWYLDANVARALATSPLRRSQGNNILPLRGLVTSQYAVAPSSTSCNANRKVELIPRSGLLFPPLSEVHLIGPRLGHSRSTRDAHPRFEHAVDIRHAALAKLLVVDNPQGYHKHGSILFRFQSAECHSRGCKDPRRRSCVGNLGLPPPTHERIHLRAPPESRSPVASDLCPVLAAFSRDNSAVSRSPKTALIRAFWFGARVDCSSSAKSLKKECRVAMVLQIVVGQVGNSGDFLC